MTAPRSQSGPLAERRLNPVRSLGSQQCDCPCLVSTIVEDFGARMTL